MTDYTTVIERMTLEQKAALLSAGNGWNRIFAGDVQVSPLAFSDGKYGVNVGSGLQYYGAPTTRFPAPLNMARTWNTSLVARVADNIGNEARSLGVNALDTPEGGVIIGGGSNDGDSLSEDPYLSGRMLTAYVRGFENNKVLATMPYGGAARTAFGDGEKALREIALEPYEMAVKDGDACAVRLADGYFCGTRVCESRHLVAGILHDEWGFDGMVIAEDNGSVNLLAAMSKGAGLFSSENAEAEAQKIIKAVNKFRKLSEDVKHGHAKPDALAAAVTAGEAISDMAVNRAVERLLMTADKHAIYDIPTPDSYESYPFNHPMMFEERKHGATAYEAACESAVLVKNSGVLPLSDNVRVAFLGEYLFKDLSDINDSKEFRSLDPDISARMFGKVDLEVIGCSKGYDRDATAIQSAALLTDAKEIVEDADVVVVYLGNLGYGQTNGKLPAVQLDFLRKIREVTNASIVAVYFGTTLTDMSWNDMCDAVLIAGDPGQAGGKAILKILSGAVNPSGKLTETVCDTMIPSLPLEGLYGYRACQDMNIRERYPFGFGLSYTRFEYSELKITGKGVSFNVTNVGDVAGAEIAQLYVGKNDSAAMRVKRELKGFCKVFLEPEQTKTVEIPFDSRTFRYYNTDTNSWETEGGTYQIYVGTSSRSIKLSGERNVPASDARVPAGGGAQRRNVFKDVPKTIRKVEKKFSVKSLIGVIVSFGLICVIAALATLFLTVGGSLLMSVFTVSESMVVPIEVIGVLVLLVALIGVCIWFAVSLSRMVTKNVYEIPNPAAKVGVDFESYTADERFESDREIFPFDEPVEHNDDEEEDDDGEENEPQATEASEEAPHVDTEEEIVAASDPVIKFVRIQHTAFEGIEAGVGELCRSFEEYADARGIIAREGELRRLFASFMSSRVITLRAGDMAGARITMRVLAECFDMNVTFINANPEDERIRFVSTENSQGIVSAVNAALSEPNKPSIALICGANITDIPAFLGNIVEYAGLPASECNLAMPDGTLRRFKLPSNLWFVIPVSDEICVETGTVCVTSLHAVVPRVVNLDTEALSVGEEKVALHTYPLSVTTIKHTVARAREEFFLSEKYWRKIDKLDEYIASKVRFSVTNKQLNVMEKYVAVCVAAGADQEEAMDCVMSALILGRLRADDARRFDGDETLTEFMDSVFGAEKDDRSRELLKLKGIK